jgi:hypothetical protein
MTGLTTWERHEAGLPPRDREETARCAEMDACDADRAYAAQKRIFGGEPADAFEAALFAESAARAGRQS